jgi:hypothetical protein
VEELKGFRGCKGSRGCRGFKEKKESSLSKGIEICIFLSGNIQK